MKSTGNCPQASSYVSKHLLSDQGLIYGGCWIAIVCSPLYYLIWTYIFPQTYDSLFLRLSSSVLALIIILNRYWPSRLQKFFPPIWLFTLLYVVPFTHFFLALKNQFSTVWIVCITFVPFMLAYFVRTPWMTLLLLAIATLCSLSIYVLIDGLPSFLIEFRNLSPLIVFIVGGAAMLSYSNLRALVRENKARVFATQDLAGSIAYEMRNPLAQIHGNLYLIEELQKEIPYMYKAKPMVVQYIDNAKRVIESGLQTIDITMDAIRDKPVNHEEFKLLSAKAVVDQAVADYAYEELTHAKLVSVEGEDFMLKADPVMMKYVLFNLLKNALWYVKTLPDSEVSISLIPSEDGRFHTIEVRDDGPGVSPEEISSLFDGFFTSGRHRDTGLGLSYCKRSMRALGGDIQCHSELNLYTVFTLSFPVVSEEVSKQRDFIQKQQEHETLSVSLANKSVLIVDDNDFSRRLIESMLEKLEIRCISTKNGQQALQILREHHCDLVITDMQMPVMDGAELIKQIRSCSQGGGIDPGIPIIALTADSGEMIETAIQAGVNDYLIKPITVESLLAKLGYWLR